MAAKPASRKHLIRSRILCLLTLFAAFIVTQRFPTPPAAQAAQATLTWTAPTTYPDGTPITNLAGYRLYVGNAPGSYQQSIDVGNQASYTVGSLQDGSTYYFAATAYDAAGTQSTYSNEVSKTFPALATTYQITASSGTGGTVTALNNFAASTSTNGTTTISGVTVKGGATQSFSISAAGGYSIADVTVDGASVGPVASYTFSNVTTNHTIAVTFTVASSYAISATTTMGGSISPAGTTAVASGGSLSYSITPAAGYAIAYVLIDGKSVGVVSSYSFTNVTANHTIKAGFYAFAVNSGGGNYPASTGVLYLGDTRYSGGYKASASTAINGTQDAKLYQSWRYGNFTYAVPVQNGNYDVKLKFCENLSTAANQRVFNVVINGRTVLSNLDVYAVAGKNTAYDVIVPVSVTSGSINIKFVSVIGNAMVNGILITAK